MIPQETVWLDHLQDIEEVTSGGTINEVFNVAQSTTADRQVGESFVPSYVRKAFHAELGNSETVCLLDSSKLTVELRQRFLARIFQSAYKKSLATIGTNEMANVAREGMQSPVYQHFQHMDHMGVFTGSLVFMKNAILSDAGFNIGESIAFLQHPAELIRRHRENCFLVMNGGLYNPLFTRKDRTTAKHVGTNLLCHDTVSVVLLGGTPDFELDGFDGLRPRKQSLIPSFLQDGVMLGDQVEIVTPTLQDSRNTTEDDLDLAAQIINDSNNERTLMVAGYYEAQRIRDGVRKRLGAKKLKEKRIVLVGGRRPMDAHALESDSPGNLGYGFGLLAADLVPPGDVHFAANAQVAASDQDPLEIAFSPEERKYLLEQGYVTDASDKRTKTRGKSGVPQP